jgi:hypothetical protein
MIDLTLLSTLGLAICAINPSLTETEDPAPRAASWGMHRRAPMILYVFKPFLKGELT